MANTRSAKKRMRQNYKRRGRNKAILSRTRNQVRAAQAAIAAGDAQLAAEAVGNAVSLLDRAVARGAIHRNNADRRKGRLMRHLEELQQTS